MRPQDARKLIRSAARAPRPRKALDLLKRAERALGERLDDARDAIGRQFVDRARYAGHPF
jgi:hypothetical protein